MRRCLIASVLYFACQLLHAQLAQPPIIDIHVHSNNVAAQDELDRMKRLNIRYAVVTFVLDDLPSWSETLATDRFLPGLAFPCPNGRSLFLARPCWEGDEELPDIQWLEGLLESDQIRALGELTAEYSGLAPNDPKLEPYWVLAERYDVPVMIHMGPGPAGAAYAPVQAPFTAPNYRVAAGDPLLLEDVLLRHKRLRVLVMHAGWPFLDSTIALLHGHPNVYLDVAALQSNVPRKAYYSYLEGLIDAGFRKRIAFGSDFPNQLEGGIEAILEAPFLDEAEKRDILCINAATFLRLERSICE